MRQIPFGVQYVIKEKKLDARKLFELRNRPEDRARRRHEFHAKVMDAARQDFADHFFRSNALHCTATARILIPAECSAIS